MALLGWLRKKNEGWGPEPRANDRRSASRQQVNGLGVELSHRGTTLVVRSVNLSFSGALFKVDDPQIADLTALSQFCGEHFAWRLPGVSVQTDRGRCAHHPRADGSRARLRPGWLRRRLGRRPRG